MQQGSRYCGHQSHQRNYTVKTLFHLPTRDYCWSYWGVCAVLFSFHAVMEEATCLPPWLVRRGLWQRANAHLPSQQRVCVPPDAMHGESGLSILRRWQGGEYSTHKLCNLKTETCFSLFFPPLLFKKDQQPSWAAGGHGGSAGANSAAWGGNG